MTITGLFYDLLVAAGILLAALGLGQLALRPLRLGEPGLVGLWLAAAAGLGLLSWLTLLLGYARLYYGWLAALLIGGLGLVGLWALVGGVRAHRAAAVPWPRGVDDRPTGLALAGFLLIGATSLLWILLAFSLLPPVDWDVLAYHLEMPRQYALNHGLVYVPDNPSSNWPLAFEMLFTLALLLGSDIAAHLLILGCTALAAVGLLLVARRLLDDRAGAIAVALFLTVPTVKRLGGLAMVDVAMGLHVLAGAYCFERWVAGRGRGWLVLAGACCGFSASSKLTGGGFAIIYGLILLWGEGRRWLASRRAGGPSYRPQELVANATIFGLVGLALVGPWYLRSYLNTGNPIYPFAFHIFGGRNWDALGDEYHTQQMLVSVFTEVIPKTPLGLAQSFIYMLARPEALGGYRGHLGRLLPVGMLLATVLLPWLTPFLRRSLLVSAAFWAMWFFLSSHQARFLLPIAPLLALLTAGVCVVALDLLRRPALQLAALGLLALAILPEWPWAYAGERALALARLPYLSGQQSRAAFLDEQIDVMPLFRYANSELPPDARVLLLPYESRGYYLERDYLWGHPIGQRVIRFEQHGSAEELLRTLQGLGVTHVIENPNWIFTGLRYWEQDRALMLDLEARCSDALFRHEEGAVFALREACRPLAAGQTP